MIDRAKLPRAFVALHEDGRLVILPTGAEWERRCEVLAWRTVAWTRSLADVLCSDSPTQLVTFATAAAYLIDVGEVAEDTFAYDVSHATDEPPVVLRQYDDPRVAPWATDFSAFLLRHLAMLVTTWDQRFDGDPRIRNAVWDAHVDIVSPHLHPRHREWLIALGRRPTARHCERLAGVIADEAAQSFTRRRG